MQEGGFLVLFLLVAVLKAHHQVVRLLDEHLHHCSWVRQRFLAGAGVQLLDVLLELLLDLLQ